MLKNGQYFNCWYSNGGEDGCKYWTIYIKHLLTWGNVLQHVIKRIDGVRAKTFNMYFWRNSVENPTFQVFIWHYPLWSC